MARRGLGLPAVASLTLAETIHLVWRGPPWVERGTCQAQRLHAREGRNAHGLRWTHFTSTF